MHNTYTHVYIHTYIHTYIYTYTYIQIYILYLIFTFVKSNGSSQKEPQNKIKLYIIFTTIYLTAELVKLLCGSFLTSLSNSQWHFISNKFKIIMAQRKLFIFLFDNLFF